MQVTSDERKHQVPKEKTVKSVKLMERGTKLFICAEEAQFLFVTVLVIMFTFEEVERNSKNKHSISLKINASITSLRNQPSASRFGPNYTQKKIFTT